MKKITMILCAFMLTIGLVGGQVSESDAATKVTCKYTLDASMGPAAGLVASSSRTYAVYLQSSTGSRIKLGTATKSGSKYVLKGSNYFTMNSGEKGKLKIVIIGKDNSGTTRTWSSSYSSISATTKSKTFKVRGYVSAPTFSIS